MAFRSVEKSKTTTNSHPGCLLGFAVVWTMFSAFFIFLGLSESDLWFVLCGGLFVLVGLGMISYALLLMVTQYKIGTPDFHLSQTTLKVGESFSFNFSHTFPRAVTIGEIRTQLIFREKATYQQGTDTKTVTHDYIIATREVPGGQFSAGNVLNQNYTLQIPPDGMHTLKVRRNELTWLVKFEASIANLPNYVKEFELAVLPEIARKEKGW
jgi:hypothetical protein